MADRLTEEFVRSELAKEGWVLVGNYKNSTTKIIVHNPKVFDGHFCHIRFSNWRKGKRPGIPSLIDVNSYMKYMFSKEGWTLLNEYKSSSDFLYISNPNKFDGHICQIKYDLWKRGHRPSMESLVDKTEYIRHQLSKEGWILLSEQYPGNREPFLLMHPNKFDGHTCQIRWGGWLSGDRPAMHSLVDKTEYVRQQLAKEGWELLSPYTGSMDTILIKNENKLCGEIVNFSWYKWITGSRPNIQGLVNPTEYVKKVLLEKGYMLSDSNWEYKHSAICFRIRDVETGDEYSIDWRRINRGDLPNTPKYRITRTINNFCKKKNLDKGTHEKLLGKLYWKALKEKFPEILPNQHIDHIVPLSFFSNTWEQMVLANEIRNLRLLTKKENMKRGNRLRASELDQYDLWDLYYQAENPDCYKLIEDRDALAS